MSTGKNPEASRNQRRRLSRPRRQSNIRPNGASFARPSAALRGAQIPDGALPTAEKPIHSLSKRDEKIIASQIHTVGIAHRACPECGKPLTPDHFHPDPARTIDDVSVIVSEAYDEVTAPPPRSREEALRATGRSHAEILSTLTNVLYEPSLEAADNLGRVGPILTTIRAVHNAIEEHMRKLAIARRVIARRVAREQERPVGRREAKRALVGFAIDAGYSDARIEREHFGSRDLARDVRKSRHPRRGKERERQQNPRK